MARQPDQPLEARKGVAGYLWSQLARTIDRHRLLSAGLALALAGQSAVTLLQPWPVRELIDHLVQHAPDHAALDMKYDLPRFALGVVEGFVSTRQYDFLFVSAFFLALLAVSGAALLYMQNVLLARLGQKALLAARQDLLTRLVYLPHAYFDQAQSGDLTARVSSDVAEIESVLEAAFTIGVRSLPTILGILAVSFAIDWIYALTFLAVIPALYAVNVRFTRRATTAARAQRRAEGAIASSVQEALCLHKAVSTMCLQDEVVEDVLAQGRRSAGYGVESGRFQGLLTAWVDGVIGLATTLVLFLGALRILHGCLTVGQLTVFLSYLASLFKPVREIGKFTSKFAKSSAALERVEEIMRLDAREFGAADREDAVAAPPFKGETAMDGITFGYDPARPVLRDFSLRVRAGERVALVGDSGSGKSTVLQLLLRLYEPQAGLIRIDGRDVRDFTLQSLRGRIAAVLQDSFLFSATIGENIALSRPGADRAEVVEAAKRAGAHEFIRKLPLGYDTPLGEGGAGLSGGQKRRLSIARAFLRQAPIVILDEPTVGLDAASEQEVMDALRELTRGRTAFIITHQLSLVVDADRIVVMSGGRIVESGRHEELLQDEGLYRKLWEAQTASPSAPSGAS